MRSKLVSLVKVIATIGPASSSSEIILAMAKEGVDGFRINFSHGTKEEWREYVKIIRESEDYVGRPLALEGDLQGPSIRVGSLLQPIPVSPGDIVIATLSDQVGLEEKVFPIPCRELFREIVRGDVIAMDDGMLKLEAIEVSEDHIAFKALTPGTITSNKAIVVLGKEIELPLLHEADMERLRFALSNDFNYIGLSYVRRASDIEAIKILIRGFGGYAKVMSKIETRSAIANLSEIVNCSDAILVARGDLGVHFPLERIPQLQQMIVETCIRSGKPVALATQLLTSMINSPSPTRSEMVDVVQAILEGIDMLILTGETAVGKYPVEAVKWLKRIIKTYEGQVKPRRSPPPGDKKHEKFAYGVVELAENIGSKIAVFTKSGLTALRIARFRPKVKVYAASPNKRALRELSVIWGIEPLYVEAKDYSDGLDKTLNALVDQGKLVEGDVALLTYGLRDEPVHIVKIVQVTSKR
ncbi:MAG: pyruvate kinase [Candidatus Methanomethylicota archaeon]|uniref:Pyruvate kinase n=1 Tax=Thermoproteota archaeon TaxID=2056631 RepID=A0A497ET69_9CREN|nr:MAG: pyruvate kinase [Candidatus Verstraetearchaeota archaeon]